MKNMRKPLFEHYQSLTLVINIVSTEGDSCGPRLVVALRCNHVLRYRDTSGEMYLSLNKLHQFLISLPDDCRNIPVLSCMIIMLSCG